LAIAVDVAARLAGCLDALLEANCSGLALTPRGVLRLWDLMDVELCRLAAALGCQRAELDRITARPRPPLPAARHGRRQGVRT
jgi:hypothetical protein